MFGSDRYLEIRGPVANGRRQSFMTSTAVLIMSEYSADIITNSAFQTASLEVNFAQTRVLPAIVAKTMRRLASFYRQESTRLL